MLRFATISGILLLSALLALLVPLALSLHHHPAVIDGTTPVGVVVVGNASTLTVDNRCDLCARLLVPGIREGHTVLTLLPEYKDISLIHREIPVSSHLTSRLKDRSPPTSPDASAS